MIDGQTIFLAKGQFKFSWQKKGNNSYHSLRGEN